MNKRTLSRPTRFSGVGIHSGRAVNLTLNPSDSGGVVFRRLDLGDVEIPLEAGTAEAENCTVIRSARASVRTVEHLLAALRMSGVDSARVDLDAEEVPILDGSAVPFWRAILAAGTVALPEERRSLRIGRPHRVEDGRSSVSFEPGPRFGVFYSIEFSHPRVGKQELELDLTPECFGTEVAPARTFGFLKDVEHLRSRGLALGASLENTVVLDESGVLNPPLRFPDEFVRHKILDLVGDLSVAGLPLVGRVRADRAGHALHLRAIRSLLADPSLWTRED
jgi:UDP-3-O-[3-hydroxymyristoyl] N-acetylglucosamine deacetylase